MEMVNFQLKEDSLVCGDLEDKSIGIRKVSGCRIQSRGSGLQRPDKESTRITEDRGKRDRHINKYKRCINREREARMETA